LYLLPFSVRNRFEDNLNNDSIVSIFAVPRGGSTWLAGILNQIPRSALVWEPLFRHPRYRINFLNPFAYSEVRNIGLWWNQHIPEEAEWPEAEDFFRKLFNRELINLKLYRYNTIRTIPGSELFIFKFCFGNLLLPWLCARFNIRPILLVRHPCAVIASQLNYGAFDYMKKNPQINVPRWTRFYEYYLPFERILEDIKTPEESLAVRWAMANIYPLQHKHNNKKWLTVSYESLVKNPEEELNRIKEWTRKDISVSERMLNTASFTSHKNRIDPQKQLAAWKDKLSKEQIRNILRVIRLVGIDFYDEDIMPDKNVLYYGKY
jgi:hypothetical protein